MLSLLPNLKTMAASGALAIGALAATPAISADDLNVRFSWKLKGEYAHLYMAEAQGYFAESDLNVTLAEGAGSQAALGALLQGQEDVVIMPGTFALSAITQGMPVKIVGLYHPRVPAVIISHPENPIVEPADLEGKRIAHAVGETGTSYLSVICEANNVDCDQIDLITMASTARVASFLQKQVDGVSVYTSNDLPIIERDVGMTFPIFNLAENGLAAPGMAAVTSDALIEERGDALGRFLEALAKGIADSKADPAAAAQAMRDIWPEGPSIEAITAQVEATVEAIPSIDGRPYGWVLEDNIASSLAVLSTDPEFGTPLPVEQYYSNALFE